ncbi:Hypothetical predicted protein [Lecanosticta acicola]|uniref:Velvet domain-containing protein n=1 Tax=Lecanosticta acicola TaxID=111012 RepID=A0AAI9EBF4_9PEZI|nr:Hypothetical predicted protein [Lecanosticta acicola]
MQAQLPPSQQNFHYNGQPPSSQSQYSANGIQYDARSQPQQQDYTNGYAHETNMNPYQQYAGGYGQPPQQPPQMPQMPPGQRTFMPNQNQLPPLTPGAPPGVQMPPVREDSNAYTTGSANHAQPMAYTAAPPQPMPQQPQSLLPPTRPTTNQAQEKKLSSSSSREGYRYSLEVVQQPQRARMCGFGDKDRRPITPPPCVRLVIVDDATGREIDVSDIASDPSFFVLQVDLWAENADREANVVRASSSSPAVSISSATTTSYPPPAEHRPMHEQPVMYLHPETGQPVYGMPYAMQLSRPGMMAPQYPGLYYPHPSGQMTYMPQTQASSSAMYTRNLIGSLTVNAARLTDPAGKAGYWFVLQDLSVRTEGHFRLRMSFIDISNHGAPGVNRGKAPVLAWTFSDRFQVYSAKKFPGVIESTPLSKCFAGQGIKIPIRKDNKNDANDDDDGD